MINDKLTKKERKYVSAQLTKKLKEMGVRDEISYVHSGTKPVMRIVEGKIITETVERVKASNPLRNMVKQLRNSSREAVESFLAMEIPAFVVPEPAPVITKPNTEGILIDPVTSEKT